jgi:hypothetical protein
MDSKFESIEEFVDCLKRGAEVELSYNDKHYSIVHVENKVSIAEAYTEANEVSYDQAEDALGYPVGSKTLGEILLSVNVLMRTF